MSRSVCRTSQATQAPLRRDFFLALARLMCMHAPVPQRHETARDEREDSRLALPGQPCLPTKAQRPPVGGPWLHEIKHDGFRVIARKTDDRVKLYSRPGNDLTGRFPLIVETLARLSLAVLQNGLASHQRPVVS